MLRVFSPSLISSLSDPVSLLRTGFPQVARLIKGAGNPWLAENGSDDRGEEPEIRHGLRKSLEDHFYPEENDWITKIDNNLIRAAGKVGTVFQDLTGLDKISLLQSTLHLTALAFMTPGKDLSIYDVLRLPGTLWILWRSLDPPVDTPLRNQVMSEAKGYHKDSYKWLRFTVFCVSACFFVNGMNHLMTEDLSHVRMIWQFADTVSYPLFSFHLYFSLTQLPKPPKKTFPQRLWEQMESTLRGPKLVPIPIRRKGLGQSSTP